MKNLFYTAIFSALLVSCSSSGTNNKQNDTDTLIKNELNIYTLRHYEVDEKIYKAFEKETGIKVKAHKGKSDDILFKLKNEGNLSTADLLLTSDAGKMERAKNDGLLQPFTTKGYDTLVPSNFIDSNHYWIAITARARAIVYDSLRTKPSEIISFENLANPEFKGQILVRSSESSYNQSLMAGMIAHLGYDDAKIWAQNIVNNMAREPKGNDRSQAKAVSAGVGNIAIMNTYYIGKMLQNENTQEKEVAEKLSIYYPNQNSYGTHVNASVAGITKYAPHKENAEKFIQFLLAKEQQELLMNANHEFPVVNNVEYSKMLKSLGTFKMDTLHLSNLGKYHEDALKIFNEVNWN